MINNEFKNILKFACQNGTLEVIKEYMEKIGDLYFLGMQTSPIVICSQNNHLDCVKYLITIPSQYPCINKALSEAIENQHREIINYFHSLNIDFVNHYEHSINQSISKCIEEGNFPALIDYLTLGHIDTTSISDSIRLRICTKAVEKGSIKTVDLLVKQGFDLKKQGSELLLKSCLASQFGVAKYLLDTGMDINAFQGKLLYMCSRNNNQEAVLFLLENGAHLEFCKMMHKEKEDAPVIERLNKFSQPYVEKKKLQKISTQNADSSKKLKVI